MAPAARKIIAKASAATLLSIAASLGLALTVVPWLGGVVDGNAWLMCILCPLFIAFPASAWQFRQTQRLSDARAEVERLHRQLVTVHGELAAAHATLLDKARHDGMTGLLNRESFLAALRQAMVAGEPGTLLLIDADHFKQINDSHGHPAGDAALRALALAITGAIGAGDLAGRLGGEEFGVLLDGMALAEAGPAAKRILEAVRRLRIDSPSGKAISLTASIGAAGLASGLTVAELVAEADEQLYRAKIRGRNRAVFALDMAAVA
ncbi:GGDEF domain-containing protein [Bosea sp. (in: a-proteobacteria)]|uniref:GGDEF domain-containing protein n=1 Tax=Bosea sp. (in: a-proteobacteria) TaxID=1871050 RepID=UPI00260B0E57|nr:GGDEF domain-containing protein [Bosea sp. (in: a-proteobacteria)]MCO5091922.1 GGDEF domain-containing protein [Bosea sp. (in: a-proteobacteria)]